MYGIRRARLPWPDPVLTASNFVVITRLAVSKATLTMLTSLRFESMPRFTSPRAEMAKRVIASAETSRR